MAPCQSLRCICLDSLTKLWAFRAFSTVRIGSCESISILARRDARRASWYPRATTAKTGSPKYRMRSLANKGSSPACVGLISRVPGTSSARSTATTFVADSTADRSTLRSCPQTALAYPGTRCSVPRGSGMSSIYSASPVVCFTALSWLRAAPSIDALSDMGEGLWRRKLINRWHVGHVQKPKILVEQVRGDRPAVAGTRAQIGNRIKIL